MAVADGHSGHTISPYEDAPGVGITAENKTFELASRRETVAPSLSGQQSCRGVKDIEATVCAVPHRAVQEGGGPLPDA